MNIIIIAARTENGVMGKDGGMPWHLPSDLKFFKRITLGYPVIMGRKTYDSIGKALPGRGNIVLTRDPECILDDAVVCHNLDYAIDLCKGEYHQVFIIGGAEVIRQAMPKASHMYLTEIYANIDGDTFFPTYDPNGWCEISRTHFKKDTVDEYPFDVVVYNARSI